MSSSRDFTTKNTFLVHTKVKNRSERAKMGHFGSFWAFFRLKLDFYGSKTHFWPSGWWKMTSSHDFTTKNIKLVFNKIKNRPKMAKIGHFEIGRFEKFCFHNFFCFHTWLFMGQKHIFCIALSFSFPTRYKWLCENAVSKSYSHSNLGRPDFSPNLIDSCQSNIPGHVFFMTKSNCAFLKTSAGNLITSSKIELRT